MYRKAVITAIGQIMASLLICNPFLVAQTTSSKDRRQQAYHQADKERLQAQQKTSAFISMNECYNNCISKNATDELCDRAIEALRTRINEVLTIHDRTATPIATVSPPAIDSEVNIIIQNNDYIFRPRQTPIPYQPPHQKPRNSFTPKPNFTPQNRFQAGDGFDR